MPPDSWVVSTKPERALDRAKTGQPWQGRGWPLAPRDPGPGGGMHCWARHLPDHPLAAEPADVEENDRDDQEQHHDSDGRAVAGLAVLEGLVVHREGDHLAGVPGPAA